jgi:hypothetical protein
MRVKLFRAKWYFARDIRHFVIPAKAGTQLLLSFD